MPRTNTTSRTSFSRPGNVTYAFSSPPGSSHKTRITLPPSSPWTSGLHWHETHTEYLQVIQGTAKVYLGGITRIYTAADSIITVPRFARHEWQRGADDEIELVVQEWTDPTDGQKEIFFRNLSSVILDATANGPPNEFWLTLQLFMVFFVLDNYPVILSGPESLGHISSWIEWVTSHCVLLGAVLVGRLLGLKSLYDEYTPDVLIRKKEE